ncbi:hypothetical protein N665_1167s0009 [Sinapis alba]|nr:hypothetical protein N665_1167s0009 [Sinapis alba]
MKPDKRKACYASSCGLELRDIGSYGLGGGDNMVEFKGVNVFLQQCMASLMRLAANMFVLPLFRWYETSSAPKNVAKVLSDTNQNLVVFYVCGILSYLQILSLFTSIKM